MGQESRACGPAPTRRRAWIKSKNGSAASPRMMLLARRVICSRRVASIHMKVDGPTRLRSCRTAWAAASAHISGKERPRRPALNVRKRTERVRPADSEIVSSWNRGGCRGVLAAWLGIPLHDATAWTRRAIHLALYCAVGACFALGLLRHAALADPQSGIGRLPAAAGNGHDDECPILTEATAGAPSRPPPAPERIATAPQGETDGLSATSQSEAKPAQRGPNRRSQNARARLRAGSAVIRGWIMPRSRSAASGPGSEATAERLSLFQS